MNKPLCGLNKFNNIVVYAATSTVLNLGLHCALQNKLFNCFKCVGLSTAHNAICVKVTGWDQNDPLT